MQIFREMSLLINNIAIEISWTPGHAHFKVNERLRRQAAQEVKEKESLPPVISLGDVKEEANKSGYVKWQEMTKGGI